jgi:hypothetical protein
MLHCCLPLAALKLPGRRRRRRRARALCQTNSLRTFGVEDPCRQAPPASCDSMCKKMPGTIECRLIDTQHAGHYTLGFLPMKGDYMHWHCCTSAPRLATRSVDPRGH